MSEAKKFRGGSKNEDVYSIFNQYWGQVSTKEYEAMKARFAAQAEMCDAVIAEEDDVTGDAEFVYGQYIAKKTVLRAKVLEAYNRFRSSFKGLPLDEIGEHRYFCRWHALAYVKRN